MLTRTSTEAVTRPLVASAPRPGFEHSLQILADRVAALLSTDVVIADINQLIVASNKRTLIQQRFLPDALEQPNNDYWVPLTIGNRVVKVIASQPANGEVLSSRLLKKLVDMVYEQIASAAQPDPQALRDVFVQQLVRNQFADSDALIQQAARVGFDLHHPAYVMLVDASAVILARHAEQAGGEEVRRRAQTVITHLVNICGPAGQPVCAYVGNGEIVLLRPHVPPAARPGSAEPTLSSAVWHDAAALLATDTLLERLRTQLDPQIRLALGRFYPGLNGISRSYKEARTLLELWQPDADGACALERAGIGAFIGIPDETIRRDIAARCLAPVAGDPELLKTVAVFFAEDCCPSATARRLSIHRNTLSYRLDKVATLSGLDPRTFDDAVQLRLALLVRATYEARQLDAARPAAPVAARR